MYYSYLTIVFPVVTAFCLLMFFWYYRKASLPLKGTTEWIDRIVNRPRFTFTCRRHPMARKDILPVTVITVVYAAVAFVGLGDFTNPQSFHRFTSDENAVVITLDEPTDVGRLMYYTGLWIGSYTLEFSEDGTSWQEQYPAGDHESAMNQPHSDLFKWLYADLNQDNSPTKYIRITAAATPLELGELAIYDNAGNILPASRISCDGAKELFDEQSIVPKAPSYMNSMYFDEIYHGRTAYEYIHTIAPYETTHPPLGKLIITIGIDLFGMVPFGWRFMGTLFGVAMLPILYVFLKNMFGKTVIAACGTTLFAAEFMHYVQTRIATIDTYGVFFILLSYFFMYRYITQDPELPFKKTLPPLILSGLFFGIGCASKWIVIYAGAGLLALYVIHLVLHAGYYKRNELPGHSRFLVKTLLTSFLFYVLIPVIIYCLSYIQNGRAAGMTVSGGMLWDPKYYNLIWENQKFMFHYHATLVATHAYSSTWWQWIVDARPILYYRDTSMGEGLKSSFASFGNPIVWWGGFLAVIAMVFRVVKHRDGKALFILIGYFVQLAPWILITRVVFIYHYFPCVLFMVFALAHVLNTIWERAQGRYKLAVYGFTGAAVFLFIAFYPVLSGATVPENYTQYILRWVPPMWPF
ncbi:Dolichyl-phosphate-mannose-protein mannosyltransferase [Sporobacter termitidis DSM 10068]|uniref:Polyprenol-phosphate-mannose--protein mannosyltransferase n=1 Tax=Sporobacter termitidis DSM 10068 TaxID=1123282 RepID=A0A1M5Z4X7_9FIRM|nr:phospholipid carrier-dependent glycosyltransferase [Sporobacter termitidis]SHI19158.1 Dolichyl-phosphate-mannose-protein mannosyltransferase [Sporobacter termitidis DSM 10068]